MKLHLLIITYLLHCTVSLPSSPSKRSSPRTKVHNLELSPSDYLLGKFPAAAQFEDKERVAAAGIRRIDPSPAALIAEPDAEMLPLHYTGVKSPGVDHMELRNIEDSSPRDRITVVDEDEDVDFDKIFEDFEEDKAPGKINVDPDFFSDEDDSGFEGSSYKASKTKLKLQNSEKPPRGEYDDFFRYF